MTINWSVRTTDDAKRIAITFLPRILTQRGTKLDMSQIANDRGIGFVLDPRRN
jgi:hypothetical protein